MRFLSLAALATVLMLAGSTKSKAEDTILLGGTNPEAKTQNLLFDGQADLEQVYYRAGGYRGYVGGYRGYAGGYRGYVGYRPYAYRPYYRPYAYAGFYRPYAYYRPYVYPYYAASYYYSPYYYYPQDYSYYYSPISTSTLTLPNPTVLGSSSFSQPGQTYQTFPSEQLPPPSGDGTFQYNGGPNQSMPHPQGDGPTPTFQPKRPTVPYEGKLVSIPAKQATNYSYAAYGETTPQPVVQTTPLRAVQTAPAKVTNYPAYGDR